MVNIGTSSKTRYRYFVPTAHPGTFEIAPKDRKTKVGLSCFYEKIEVLSDRWLIIAMLFRVEIVFACMWSKESVEIELVSNESHNRVKHEVVFPSSLSTKTPLCIIYCFTRKIQAWYASPG